LSKITELFHLDKSSITFVFFLAIAILVSVFIVAYMNIKDLNKIDDEELNSHQNIESIEKLYSLIADAETGRTSYYLTNDAKYLQPYNNALIEVDSVYRLIRIQAEKNPTEQFYLDTLSMFIRERFDLFKRSIEAQSKKGNSLKLQKPFIDDGKNIQDKIKIIIERLKSEENRTFKEKIKVKNSGAKFTLVITAGGILLSICIFAFVFLTLKKYGPSIFDSTSADKLTKDELETLVRDRTSEISQLIKKLYSKIDRLSRTEAALQQSEQDYKTLFEQAHDAIIIFKPDDEIILNVNQRACDIYGIKRDEFIGSSLKSLSKNVPDGEKNIKQALEKGFLYNFQSVHYKKKGTEMLMEINASVINYKGTQSILSINRDITDRILSYIPLPGS
jgi:PAS domain S-box-containing protein